MILKCDCIGILPIFLSCVLLKHYAAALADSFTIIKLCCPQFSSSVSSLVNQAPFLDMREMCVCVSLHVSINNIFFLIRALLSSSGVAH